MTTDRTIESTRAFAKTVDFGKTASDYARHRAGFPAKFFDALEARGWIRRGLRALDLGTGTGTVARGMAQRGLSVVATDPSTALLAQAAEQDRLAGVVIDYREGRAEDIQLDNSYFHIVTAGQCWHWFDRPKAASEARRVLVSGGRLVLAHFDWLSLPGNVVEATEALISEWNPSWTLGGGAGLYPAWLTDLGTGGFDDIETFSFDVAQPYTHEAWRGRVRASAGVKATLSDAEVESFDRALAELLATKFPADPLLVPHRVWVASGRRP